MIYANSKEVRTADMAEVQRWILSLLNPKLPPTTRALKQGFISKELLTWYCKLIGHKYQEHICSKCNGEDNYVPDVQLEWTKKKIKEKIDIKRYVQISQFV